MNNLIVIESDSDEEEIIFVGNNRADSEEEDTQRPVEDAQRPVEDAQRPAEDAQRPAEDAQRPAEDAQRPIEDANQQSSSDEEPKELDPNIFESCSMCLLYFDSSAICLPCGHCFHRLCILTEKNKLKMKQCPICSRRIYNANCVRKLHINPSVLGSERMENLTCSNKRLEKRIRKIALEHEKLKDSLEAKEREAAALKSLIGQYEMDEKEASCGKEVDLQTIQRYTEGIVHACCKRDDCEHAHKFMNAINSLKMGSDFEAESKRIISISNQRFLKEAVISELKSIKGHNLDSILPFYIERCRKLDNFDGMREISKRDDIFTYQGEAFEIVKDFGDRYDQELANIYCDLVNQHKKTLISKVCDQLPNDKARASRTDRFQRDYIYDKGQRSKMLGQACAQLAKKHKSINERIDEIAEARRLKNQRKDNYSHQLSLLRKQSELLDRIKNHIKMREEGSNFCQTDQERKFTKTLKDKQRKAQMDAKGSKHKTYKQLKAEKFKKFKEKTGQKSTRGIHSSEKLQQDRAFNAACDRIFYKQAIVDFDALFKAFNIFF